MKVHLAFKLISAFLSRPSVCVVGDLAYMLMTCDEVTCDQALFSFRLVNPFMWKRETKISETKNSERPRKSK